MKKRLLVAVTFIFYALLALGLGKTSACAYDKTPEEIAYAYKAVGVRTYTDEEIIKYAVQEMNKGARKVLYKVETKEEHDHILEVLKEWYHSFYSYQNSWWMYSGRQGEYYFDEKGERRGITYYAPEIVPQYSLAWEAVLTIKNPDYEARHTKEEVESAIETLNKLMKGIKSSYTKKTKLRKLTKKMSDMYTYNLAPTKDAQEYFDIMYNGYEEHESLGYAKTYSAICALWGIPNCVVYNTDNGFAWVAVKYGSDIKFCDPTWDDFTESLYHTLMPLSLIADSEGYNMDNYKKPWEVSKKLKNWSKPANLQK